MKPGTAASLKLSFIPSLGVSLSVFSDRQLHFTVCKVISPWNKNKPVQLRAQMAQSLLPVPSLQERFPTILP